MPTIRIQSLAGVPIVYDRDPVSNYGTGGYRVRPYIEEGFSRTAEQAFAQIFQTIAATGLGQVSAVLTGGIARSGHGATYHHKHRAFDLDGLVMASGRTWVANTYPDRRFEYLLIEACLRRHFGTVLTYDYSADQQTHLHFDDGEQVGFQRHSKSRVLFLQNSLRYLFDRPVGVDGVYGPETQHAERLVRADLQIGTLTKRSNWDALLAASIEEAQDRLSYPAIEGVSNGAGQGDERLKPVPHPAFAARPDHTNLVQPVYPMGFGQDCRSTQSDYRMHEGERKRMRPGVVDLKRV